jgi:2-isopropylmalate synthase
MRRVQIFDTTLRDGEQSPGISLSVEEKVEIAHQLARLKVDVIEAGFPITSEGDFESVSRIATEVKARLSPVSLASTRRTSSGPGRRCSGRAARASTPSSGRRTCTSSTRCARTRGYPARAGEAVRLAKSLCRDVEFSPMDATRTEIGYLLRGRAAAVEAGADVINIADTVGYTTPVEFSAFLSELQERVPGLKTGCSRCTCHDDLGLAVANSSPACRLGPGRSR